MEKKDWFAFVLSVLSCSCSPGVRQGLRWIWYYCSILTYFLIKLLFTHPAPRRDVWTYSMVGAWHVKHNISLPEVQKLSKELLRRIKSLSCIAYLFIYLFQQTFIHRRRGLHEVCLLFFSNLLLDTLTVTCIRRCKEAAKWNRRCLNCSLSCSIRGAGG